MLGGPFFRWLPKYPAGKLGGGSLATALSCGDDVARTHVLEPRRSPQGKV